MGESMNQGICVEGASTHSLSTWHYKKHWRALKRTCNQRSPSVCANTITILECNYPDTSILIVRLTSLVRRTNFVRQFTRPISRVAVK